MRLDDNNCGHRVKVNNMLHLFRISTTNYNVGILFSVRNILKLRKGGFFVYKV